MALTLSGYSRVESQALVVGRLPLHDLLAGLGVQHWMRTGPFVLDALSGQGDVLALWPGAANLDHFAESALTAQDTDRRLSLDVLKAVAIAFRFSVVNGRHERAKRKSMKPVTQPSADMECGTVGGAAKQMIHRHMFSVSHSQAALCRLKATMTKSEDQRTGNQECSCSLPLKDSRPTP